ncbi:hypothetical protein Taro_033659 [Colocasia esculenta]|uniref:Uncharacterized protein n=1 Tax=Colocasia esculenta TaxID=4460 RepID=A0A843WD56_COLES|nr:hypothetical protein [Colocasia esculenta]
MLNDDTDSTEFYSANKRDVRHHVTEEHVIEEDEEDEIDSQDDIDDNENMDEGDDEPLFDIAREMPGHIGYRVSGDHPWGLKMLCSGLLLGASRPCSGMRGTCEECRAGLY